MSVREWMVMGLTAVGASIAITTVWTLLAFALL
jgi:hypothetical protein